jgi:hypothetical protein
MKQLLHTVMWRLQGDAAQRQQHIAQCMVAFEKINTHREVFPGLIDLQIAANSDALNNSPDAWHLVLVTRFAGVSDLMHYNQHALHLDIKTLMAPIKQARAVVDAWV